jgi:hypothetical protein
LGISIFHKCSSKQKWNNLIESYIVDLGLSSKSDLLSFDQLYKHYELRFQPLIGLAISQGEVNP